MMRDSGVAAAAGERIQAGSLGQRYRKTFKSCDQYLRVMGTRAIRPPRCARPVEQSFDERANGVGRARAMGKRDEKWNRGKIF
jgi:hypothetical protein